MEAVVAPLPSGDLVLIWRELRELGTHELLDLNRALLTYGLFAF